MSTQSRETTTEQIVNSLLVKPKFQRPTGEQHSGLLLALVNAIQTGNVLSMKFGKQGVTVRDVYRIFLTTIPNAARNRYNKVKKDAAQKLANETGKPVKAEGTITAYDVLIAMAGRGKAEYAPNTWEAMKFGTALKGFLGYEGFIDETDVSLCAAYMCEEIASQDNTNGYISINDVRHTPEVSDETSAIQPQSELLTEVIEQTAVGN